ncbi:MAG TPA: hypothetical protein ENO07_06975, partial [candidate division Zixibacteria bacterium]|nr:hypothetical protein [candidate division Zixibacteria bacterium]
MEITYRNLRPEDYDSLIQVWKASGLPVRLTGRDSREKITEHMKEQPDFFTGAFDRGRLIG